MNSETFIRKLMDLLVLHVEKIPADERSFVVEYSGGGDSGDVTWNVKPSGLVSGLMQGIVDSNSDLKNACSEQDIQDELLNVVSSLLPGGWEINEGSRGEVTFDIHTGQIDHHHTEYVTESVESSFHY